MDDNSHHNLFLDDIDQQLKALEEEKMLYEQKYGFKDGYSENQTIEALGNQKKEIAKIQDFGKGEKRYNLNKPTFVTKEQKFESTKPKRLKPEISQEWVVVNKLKPNLLQFYDKENFARQVLDPQDFQITSEKEPHLESYDDFAERLATI